MSALPTVHGHEDVRRRLARAVRRDALPNSLLLHGPPGVGKQRVGLWLARRLLCTGTPADDDPCGECRSCRLALRLEHPDVHWFFPQPRPRSKSSLEKLVDALEDARAETLAARRDDPYRPAVAGEPVGLYLAHVHAIRRIVRSRPAMGRRQVVLVGDADLLVPQESSPEAANAFLKLLEEPPDHTTFVLTTADRDALLPTLRSRLQPIRLRALPLDRVARFLADARGVPDARALTVARLAQGSIGRALAFLPADDDSPGPLEALRHEARSLLAAAAGDAPLPRLEAAHDRTPTGARGRFFDVLGFLSLWIRDLAATVDHADDDIINADAADFLADLARRLPAASNGAADALDAIEHARGYARGNVNPQLTLAWLLRRLHESLSAPHGPPGTTPRSAR